MMYRKFSIPAHEVCTQFLPAFMGNIIVDQGLCWSVGDSLTQVGQTLTAFNIIINAGPADFIPRPVSNNGTTVVSRGAFSADEGCSRI